MSKNSHSTGIHITPVENRGSCYGGEINYLKQMTASGKAASIDYKSRMVSVNFTDMPHK